MESRRRQADLGSTVVLVVDDSETDCSAIMKSLQSVSRDVQVHVVNDSSQAAERFDALKPALTLLDLHMPMLDGFDVLGAIRPLANHQGNRIVMLSGSTDPEDAERCRALGADDYKVKPDCLDAYRKLAGELVEDHLLN